MHASLKHPLARSKGAYAPPGRARPPPGRARLHRHQQNFGGVGGPINRLEPASARPPEVGRGPLLALHQMSTAALRALIPDKES